MRWGNKGALALTDQVFMAGSNFLLNVILARALSAAQYRQGAASAAEAVKTLNERTRQTLALADVLAEYNLSIADYALAVLPPTTPADKLAEALVVKQ